MQNLSAHIMDIAQNSVRAHAGRIEVDIEKSVKQDSYTITVTDNGHGMDAETLLKITDPFFTSRTVRKVGLGIPLLKQNAEATGGSLRISSKEGKGTCVRANFTHSHIDRPPDGDIAGTIMLLVAANPDIEIIYTYRTDKGEYNFNSLEVKEILDGVPITNPEIIQAIRQMIDENMKELD